MTEGLLLQHDPQAKEVVRDAWGQWLSSGWDWDWWVTLTYDPRKHAQGSATHTGVGWARSSRDWDQWLEGVMHETVRDDALAPPYWFRGREPNKARYGTHFHALIGGVAHVSRRDAWQRWFDQHGMARIEPYDPSRGAGFYVSKYVVKELGDLTFSPNAGAFVKGTNDDSIDSARRQYPAGWVDPSGSVPRREARG